MHTSKLSLLQAPERIILAAGHGGNDPGATHGIHKERDQTIRIVDWMAELLRDLGIEVEVAPHSHDTHESIHHVNERYRFGDAWVVEVHRDSASGLSHDDASHRCGVYYGTSAATKEIGNALRDAMQRHGANEKTWARPDTKSHHGSLGWIRQTHQIAHLLELGFMQGRNDEQHLMNLSKIGANSLFEVFTGRLIDGDGTLVAVSNESDSPSSEPAETHDAEPQIAVNLEEATRLRITASLLNLRSSPSIGGRIIGQMKRGEVVVHLGNSADGRWQNVLTNDGREGWAFSSYLAIEIPSGERGLRGRILEVAERSAAANFEWPDRGRAPQGYTKGMALVYANLYQRLLEKDPVALEIARPDSGNKGKDALAVFADEFERLGLENDSLGVDTFRHVFVLLLGLGMRESSGRHCLGVYAPDGNYEGHSAEAGLFQTSYSAGTPVPMMLEIFRRWRDNPGDGLRDVFVEGASCGEDAWRNHGSGPGLEFQRLSKEHPAFAAEFSAVGLRHRCRHWGPIAHYPSRNRVDIRTEADELFMEVQSVVDSHLSPI